MTGFSLICDTRACGYGMREVIIDKAVPWRTLRNGQKGC